MRLAAQGQPRVLHIGRYWRRDIDVVWNMLQGLRRTGALVVEVDTDTTGEALDTSERAPRPGSWGPTWLRWERIGPIVEEAAPDLIVCNAGGLSFRPEVAHRLRERCCLLGIALSDPNIFDQCTRRIAPNFDAFLTNTALCLDAYRSLGVNVRLLDLATNEEHFHPAAPRAELVCDVLVVGRAHSDREGIVRRLCAELDTHVYGEGWAERGFPQRPLLYGEDFLAALGSARAVVVLLATPTGEKIPKVYLCDYAAAGALVVTDRIPEVEPYLTYGEEVIGFDDADDLVRKLRHYLANPAEAGRVRDAGRARVLRDHTWTKRWAEILEWLRAE